MELILVFLGAFIIIITLKKVIEENIVRRFYIKKTAKIIGFENSYYKEKDYGYSEEILYPILEVEEKNEVVNLVLPIYENNNTIKQGKSIDIIYPEGKIEYSKIYNYDDNMKIHYLNMIFTLIIIFISTTNF